MAKQGRRQAAAARPVALLVLGMHRSGTSALTRVLNLLGASLGDDLMPPGDDNPLGFWEHQGIVSVHEALLVALERRWDDPRPMPDDWLESEPAREAGEAIAAVNTCSAASTSWSPSAPAATGASGANSPSRGSSTRWWRSCGLRNASMSRT